MELRINIGELDTLVEVQSCTIGRGDKGQKTYTFASMGKHWAKIEESIDEGVSNGNLEQGRTLTATIYKLPNLDTRCRVVIDGVGYTITGIDPISRFSRLCRISLWADGI